MTFDPSCPVPATTELVELAHGGGGRTTRRLLEERVLPALGLSPSAAALDAAVLPLPTAGRLAFTTDAAVVRPTFFPGGDLGRLAVFGAVNDLVAVGARPLALSLALIAEEGTPLELLSRVLRSVGDAARAAAVPVVTGDTKVVERGKGDGVYAVVSGLGVVPEGVDVGPSRVRTGDAVLVSGDLGRHGVTILSAREGLGFEAELESDCAPLGPLLDALLASGAELHALRDPTRGGLSAALNELARDGRFAVELEEDALPVGAPVAAACEVLGLEPLSMACEGRLVVIAAEADADRALAALRATDVGAGARRVGRVTRADPRGEVTLRTRLGTLRAVDFVSGEALPRIC